MKDAASSMSASSGASASFGLPSSLHVIERGWLSANTVIAIGEDIAVVDTGYHTHGTFMQAALNAVIGTRSVDRIFNTHLHSDHCGGNALLQRLHADVQVSIPVSTAERVQAWSQAAQLYDSVGQQCPPFTFAATHADGDHVRMGHLDWRVIASPGHDSDSVMFFNDEHRILMSADALWEDGFGVLFPLLDGHDAVTDQQATLDLIDSLKARVVIPGHGGVFTEVNCALDRARARIDSFADKPDRAIRNAFRVLVKFNLLESRQVEWSQYRQQFANYAAIRNTAQRYLPPGTDLSALADQVAEALVAAGAAQWNAGCLCDR